VIGGEQHPPPSCSIPEGNAYLDPVKTYFDQREAEQVLGGADFPE